MAVLSRESRGQERLLWGKQVVHSHWIEHLLMMMLVGVMLLLLVVLVVVVVVVIETHRWKVAVAEGTGHETASITKTLMGTRMPFLM